MPSCLDRGGWWSAPSPLKSAALWQDAYGTLAPLGDATLDVYLNDHAFWHNVPLPVWRYKLGGGVAFCGGGA